MSMPAEAAKFGGVDWAQYGVQPTRVSNKAREDVDRANTLVNIGQLLRDKFGVWSPDGLDRSWKINCPFNFEHADGGVDKNCRVYPDSNHAYCFADLRHGLLSPVRVWQLKTDTAPMVAAKALLELYGLTRRTGWRDRYVELLKMRESSTAPGAPAYAVEALQSALGQVEDYDQRQYDGDVTTAMEDELEKLDRLLAKSTSGREALREWYVSARDRMSEVVRGTDE